MTGPAVGGAPREGARISEVFGIDFSDEQLRIITSPLEPSVVVAGAGSGKTTVMAARVTALVADGLVEPDRVLGLTFTNKAAAELANRVRWGLAGIASGPHPVGRAGDEWGEPTISTYHSFAHRVIEEHGLRLGIEPTSQLVTEGTRYQLAYRVACRTGRAITALTSRPSEVAKSMVALDAMLAERMVSPPELITADQQLIAMLSSAVQQRIGREMLATAQARIELAQLVDDFRAAKREHDVIDFSDQLRLCAELALTCPEVAAVLREQYRVVLLDEYQDTSITQRVFMQALFGAGHPVTAVGDPCQGIYAWRGAEVANIDDFPLQFPVVRSDGSTAPAPVYPLSVNRRSAERILHVANTIAIPLHAIHADVVDLRAGRPELGPGDFRIALLETEAEEIDWIADQIAGLASEVNSWGDVAVLCRDSKNLGAIHAALAARAVPAHVVGKSPILDLPEVVDVISMLEVIHDPSANAALVRLLAGPRWRIGPRDLAVLGRRAAALVQDDPGQRRKPGPEDDDKSVTEQLDNAVAGTDPVDVVSLVDAVSDPGADTPLSAAARERMGSFADEISRLRSHVGEPLVDFIHRVVAVTGLDVELSASPEAVAADRRDSIAAFVELAAEFRDLDREATLGAFLAWLGDLARLDDDPGIDVEPAVDAVSIMTVHKAKGLEWPIVAVPFLTQDVFPNRMGGDRWPKSATTPPLSLIAQASGSTALQGDPRLKFPSSPTPRSVEYDAFVDECKRLDELDERRLAYVAITRAERRVLASGSWWGPTQKNARGPSPYLEILREECERGAGSVDVWVDQPGDDATSPVIDAGAGLAWPVTPDPEAWSRRRDVAQEVLRRRDLVAGSSTHVGRPDGLSADECDLVSAWDDDIALMLDSVRRDRVTEWRVPLPGSLSVSAVLDLARDGDAFAQELRRPMPRRPVPAARRGSELHAWIESQFGEQPLLPPDDLPGATDAEIDSDSDLAAMKEVFRRSAYAARVPYAIEAPVTAVFGGHVVAGRIDAVFRDGDKWELVDWKTNRRQDADPLQLAMYRIAWSEAMSVPLEAITAGFVYLRTGDVVMLTDLPDRAAVERLLPG